MKKILSAFLALTLLITFIPCAAESEPQILFPYDKAVLQANEIENIVFHADKGEEAVIFLDGDKIFECMADEHETIVPFVKEPALGEHCIELFSGGKHKKAAFSVIKETAVTLLEATYTNKKVYSNGGAVDAGVDENGGKVELKKDTAEGTDGETGRAISTIMKTAPTTESYKQTQPVWTVNAFNDSILGILSGYTFTLSYDIKMLSDAGVFEVYTTLKNSSNNTVEDYFGGQSFVSDGKIKGMDTEYPIGEWIHIEHIVDTSAHRNKTYVDGVLASDRDFPNVPKVWQFNFIFSPVNVGKAPQGFVMDNIKITKNVTYTGCEKLYANEGEGFEEVKDSISPNTGSFMVSLSHDSILMKEDSLPKVYANGVLLRTSGAVQDGNDIMFHILSKLPKRGEMKIYFETENGFEILKKAEIKPDFGLEKVIFKEDGDEIYLLSHLKEGKSLTCVPVFENTLSENKEAIFILVVYRDSRPILTEMKAVKIDKNSVGVISEDDAITVTVLKGNITVQCSLIDGFLNRAPLSKVWTLG